jgi:hypothetical protein
MNICKLLLSKWFKQENIYQFKYGLKTITTIILYSRRGVPLRPSMLVFKMTICLQDWRLLSRAGDKQAFEMT